MKCRITIFNYIILYFVTILFHNLVLSAFMYKIFPDVGVAQYASLLIVSLFLIVLLTFCSFGKNSFRAIRDKVINTNDKTIIISVIMLGVFLSFTTYGLYGLQVIGVIDIAGKEYFQGVTRWNFEHHLDKNPINFTTVSTLFIFLYFLRTIVGSIMEELVFRRGIFGLLIKKHSLFYSMIITSLLFLMAHKYDFFLSVFAGSILYCYVYYKTENIVYSMILHITSNFSIFAINAFGGNKMLLNKSSEHITEFRTWSTEFIAMLISMVLILYILRNYLYEKTNDT